MCAFTKAVGILTIATLTTFFIFIGLSKSTKLPVPEAKNIAQTKIVIEPKVTFEYSSESFKRPPMPETKNKHLDDYVISGPIGPIPDIPFCNQHVRETPCKPVIHVSKHESKSRQPLLRLHPIMPQNAKRSGSCIFSLEVNAFGRPSTVNDLKCTESIFIQPTQTVVMRWVFQPNIVDGESVAFTVIDQKVIYKLHDEDGYIIPE